MFYMFFMFYTSSCAIFSQIFQILLKVFTSVFEYLFIGQFEEGKTISLIYVACMTDGATDRQVGNLLS